MESQDTEEAALATSAGEACHMKKLFVGTIGVRLVTMMFVGIPVSLDLTYKENPLKAPSSQILTNETSLDLHHNSAF